MHQTGVSRFGHQGLAATLKAVAFIVALAAAVLHCSLAANAADFVIAPSELTSFRYGGRTYRVWESVRNAERPMSQRQFRYDPVVMLETESDGRPHVVVTSVGADRRANLVLHLDTADAQELAWKAVQVALGLTARDIPRENVFSLPIETVVFGVAPDPRPNPPASGFTLLTTKRDFAVPEQRTSVTFAVDQSIPQAEIADRISLVELTYQLTLPVRGARRSFQRVSLDQLRQTTLLARLDGLGTTEVYVHRDDLRHLAETSNLVEHNEIVTDDPSFSARSIADSILKRFAESVSTDTQAWAEEKWAATYNAEDLRPDRIEHELNRVLTKVSDKRLWTLHKESGGGGGFSVFGVLSASGGGSSTYDEKQIRDYMMDHDVHVEYDGNLWRAKSVRVMRLNLAQLRSSHEHLVAITLLTGETIKAVAGSLVVFEAGAVSSAGLGFQARLGEVERRVATAVPVGAVIDWYALSADVPIPDGYVLCDGAVIEDQASVFKGLRAPNLIDRFVMCVSRERQGELGGRPDIPQDGQHSHGGSTTAIKNFLRGPINFGTTQGVEGDFSHDHGIRPEGAHNHGGENRPPYFGLVKLLRVR